MQLVRICGGWVFVGNFTVFCSRFNKGFFFCNVAFKEGLFLVDLYRSRLGGFSSLLERLISD